MTDHATTPTPPADEVDLLLPWYATGRLPDEDSARIRHAMESDPDIARRLGLAEEEMAAAVSSAEALPVPSLAARQRLFERIGVGATAGAVGREASAARGGIVERVLGWLATLGPRPIAWAGAAAALLIVVQAGFIAANLVGASGTATYRTASHDGGVPAGQGSFALVSFAPGARVAEVTAFLAERGFVVADGPRGGLYRVRLSAEPLPPADRDRTLADLRARTDLVAFAAPSP